jgi:predicted dehydrogenase
MRVAVIGLGVIGKVHIKVILETEHDLVAVCDTDKEKRLQYPDIKGYADYLKMLDEMKPDAVHICTPHHLHAEMIIAALNRDIHVLCEKPICIAKEDIPLVLAAEKRSRAQLGVCFQNRYNPATLFVKEYLQNKQLISAQGELRWRRDENYYLQSNWRGKKATEGGGVLINQALHTIDLLQYFCGMPKSVVGVCENHSLQGVIEVEDTAKIYFQGENDVTIYATNAADKDYPVEIVFQTKKETVRMLSDGVYINDRYYDGNTNGDYYGKKIYGVGHRTLIYDFYDCITNGKKFPINGEEAIKAVKIVLAAYESQGRETELC